jgi:FtsH-binding integral membrane protein
VLVLFAGTFVAEINPVVFIIGYAASAIIGAIITNRSDNPWISFLGYNMIAVPIGLLLSVCLPAYALTDIITAIICTIGITIAMMVISMAAPGLFEKLGSALFISLLVAIIAELIASLCGYQGNLFSWLFILIFSGYIGYDWYKASSQLKTVDNAIDAAVELYLDIVNLFIRLLSILGRRD